MEFSQFHFETPVWLVGLGLLPLIGILYSFFSPSAEQRSRLEGFIDAHLLPHLLLPSSKGRKSIWRSLSVWALSWVLLMIGLANPRWDYTDIHTFSPDQSLCILLDISQSMDVQDVKPSRLIRARQKIEDIITHAQGLKISLVAFAADPHMISPLTDDMETIRNFLPSLGTDLAYVQGSRLSPALMMASRLLESAQGKNKSILIVSDGGFEDTEALELAKQLAQKGLFIYTMGVGTSEGGPIPTLQGGFIKKAENPVISHLDQERLMSVAQAGRGQYFTADYLDQGVKTLLHTIKQRSTTDQHTEHTTRQWEERFYIFIFPLLALLLLWFRRGFVFPLLFLVFFLPTPYARAQNFTDFFKNEAQLGQEAFEGGNYAKALEKFTDPYRQGIAAYKAGQFSQAEKLFLKPQRPEIALDALYNLGNALAMQQKLEEAIKAYEDVLQKQPNHEKAKHNLDIVKKLREQKKEQEKQKEEEKKEEKDDQKDDKSSGEQQDKKDNGQNGDKEDKDQSGSSEGQPEEGKNKDKGKEGQQDDTPPQDQENSQNQSQREAEDKQSPSSSQDTPEESPENKPQDQKESKQDAQKPEHKESQPNPPQEAEEKNNTGSPSQDQNPGSQRPEQALPQPASPPTQQDLDANQWLNQITNNPKSFLKNQFYIESQEQETKQGLEPW